MKKILSLLLMLIIASFSVNAAIIGLGNENALGRFTSLNWVKVNATTIEATNLSVSSFKITNPAANCTQPNYFRIGGDLQTEYCAQVNESALIISNAAGWANDSSSNTYTTNQVGIGVSNPTVSLDMQMTSTGDYPRFYWNVTSAFVGAIKIYKSGNSSSNSGQPRSGDELAVIESDIMNGSGSFVRRAGLFITADNNHDGSTTSGSRFTFYATNRTGNELVKVMGITSTGVSITTSTSVGTQPNDMLYVNGDINVTQTIKFNSYQYPACSSSAEGRLAYNFTSHKHVGCNGTAWNNLY